MPVITLMVEWTASVKGWFIQICGPNITTAINLSPYNFVKGQSAPYEEKFLRSNKRVGKGPEAWWLSPAEEPLFKSSNGATMVDLPIGHVTQYLDILEGHGYKIVAQSMDLASGQAWRSIAVWTLHKDI